ncbi:MAG: type II toxin-antitoxin system VapC family toxin [Actinomycetota bacterium]|jgi:predicted nucleic acid-binding protein|nr:type II toxin-antitoxin system VapC family toxin [Actinomycetota bacterium]
MPFVLDNSVVMAWCFEDEDTEYADGVLELLDADTAITPSIWPLEIANAILMSERRGRLSAAGAARFTELVSGLTISVERTALLRALGAVMEVGRTHSLISYDAAYLELAMRRGLPLATLDNRLADAARQADVTLIE